MALLLCDFPGCKMVYATQTDLSKHKVESSHVVVAQAYSSSTDPNSCTDDSNNYAFGPGNEKEKTSDELEGFEKNVMTRDLPWKNQFRCTLGCSRTFQSWKAREAHGLDTHTRSWIERGVRNPWKIVALVGGALGLGSKLGRIRESFQLCRCAIAATAAPYAAQLITTPHRSGVTGGGWSVSQYLDTIVRDYPYKYAASGWTWIILGAAVAFLSYKCCQNYISTTAMHRLCNET